MSKRNTRQYVRDILENQGIEYGLIHYSEFKEYDDPEFHMLREEFIRVHRRIIEHLDMEEQ
jgi:hypothetical protein